MPKTFFFYFFLFIEHISNLAVTSGMTLLHTDNISINGGNSKKETKHLVTLPEEAEV